MRAEVKQTPAGPRLRIGNVEVRSWLGTNFNDAAYVLADEINAVINPPRQTVERKQVLVLEFPILEDLCATISFDGWRLDGSGLPRASTKALA